MIIIKVLNMVIEMYTIPQIVPTGMEMVPAVLLFAEELDKVPIPKTSKKIKYPLNDLLRVLSP